MPKRDRAAYMRAYRAKRAKREAVSAPPPVRKLDNDPTTIRAMTQSERDAILRKINR